MVKITKKSVIFTLDVDAKDVKLKGSWNDWKEEPMKKNKEGLFTKTKRLKPGRYEFGYLVDGVWMSDESLPSVPSPYGSQNSVLEVKP